MPNVQSFGNVQLLVISENIKESFMKLLQKILQFMFINVKQLNN